jgi:hypothetical protein
MERTLNFLKKINVSDDIITKLTSNEDVEETFLDEAVNNYSKSREDYWKTTILPDHDRKVMDSTLNGYTLKVKKDLNRKFDLGFTNSQLEAEDFKSIDKFYDVLKTAVDKKLSESTSNADDAIKSQLSDYQKKYTTATEELESMKDQIENVKRTAQIEKETEIANLKSEIYLSNLIANDTKIATNVPGRDFSLEHIRKEILTNYRIENDGTIKTKDGNNALHPEKQIVVTHVVDIYEWYKNKAGLIPVSNGNAPGGVATYNLPQGGRATTAASDAARAKMEELARLRQQPK